jgi:hypothetical protein
VEAAGRSRWPDTERVADGGHGVHLAHPVVHVVGTDVGEERAVLARAGQLWIVPCVSAAIF